MKRKLLFSLTVVAFVVAGVATYAWASSSADTQTINACLNDEGKLRLVPAVSLCRKSESPLSWNTVGPPGQQGLQGVQGPQGAPGRDGRDASGSDPNAVAGTLSFTGQKQGTFSTTVTGLTHEIVSPRDAATGQPNGKRQHKPITITKELDASSPRLLTALTTNENLTSVLIGLLKDGTQVATIKLTDASVSDYATHGMTESWSFTYRKIEWTWIDGGVTASDDWEAPIVH